MDSVVGALVTEGCRLSVETLIELVMPCIPPYEPLIERAVEIIQQGLADAEEVGMIVQLGPRVVLTAAGRARGAVLFEEIVRMMSEEDAS